MQLAMDMLYLHLRLIQSALGQKVEAEPVGRCPRERSQGRAAMRGHEVASFPGEMELPLGWSLERVTSFLAKFARRPLLRQAETPPMRLAARSSLQWCRQLRRAHRTLVSPMKSHGVPALRVG